MKRQNLIPGLLKQRDITSYGLSKILNVSPNTIKKIVDADAIPDRTTYKTLRRIAQALGVRLDSLERCYE